MLRASLLLLGVVCLAARFSSVSGAASLEFVFYDTDDCSGPEAGRIAYQDTGVCDSQTDDSGKTTYSAAYCSNDGANIYSVTYSDSACTKSNAKSVDQAKASSCTNGYKTECANPTQGPTNPLGNFPPAGWLLVDFYVNRTTGHSAGTCTASADIAVTTTATKLDNCLPREVETGAMTPNAGTASYCAENGNSFGDVIFSDSFCTKTSTAVMGASIIPTGCNHKKGYYVTCPSDAPTFPTLPKIGATAYASDDCSDSAPVGFQVTAGTCFDAETVTCGMVDGTEQFIVTSYSDPTKTGRCTGTTSTKKFPTEECTHGSEYQSKYSCEVDLKTGGAATTASASMLAVTFAAIVALLSSLAQ